MAGKILYLDSERVVIATTESENRKTGDMVQVWILARDVSPVDAVRAGSDSTVCGDCKHRGGFAERTCYVNVGQAPSSVWRAFRRGSYDFLEASDYSAFFRGRKVRFGAYGDPAYMPLDILAAVAEASSGWTGYTHQWRVCDPGYRQYLMASVDTVGEYLQAKAAGWRTFRVRNTSDFLLTLNEITCPASNEAGHRTQCERCLLCSGSRENETRKDISILVHGVGSKNFVALATLGAAC